MRYVFLSSVNQNVYLNKDYCFEKLIENLFLYQTISINPPIHASVN